MNDGGIVDTLRYNVSTDDLKTVQCKVSTDDKNNKMAMISPKPGSISTIIRSCKSIVRKKSRHIHAIFGWQSRFHNHIIRDAQLYDNIQNYILQNPEKWQEDKFYS